MKNNKGGKNAAIFNRFRDLFPPGPRATAGGGFLLALTVGLVYWPSVKYPFIQDDWCVLNSLSRDGIWNFLSTAIFSHQSKFYRPFSQLVIAVLYYLFGLNPTGYHIAALILHTVNAILVVFIARRCVGNGFSAWIVGFLYAAAASLQMDPLFWVVGMNDLCAALMFFLALLFFLRKNPPAAFAFFLLGLLSKESVIVLPLIFFIIRLFWTGGEGSWGQRFENSLRSVVWYLAAAALYIAFRFYGIRSQAGASLVDQYQIQFFGMHLITNLLYYAEWFAESVTCTDNLPIVLVILVWLVPCLAFILSGKRKQERTTFLVLGFWSIAGILPVIFLTNHPFRYYLVYSLPALLMILVSSLTLVAKWRSMGEERMKTFLAAATTLVILGSGYYLLTLDRQGFVGAESIQGSNNLLRKGALITTVRDDLLRDAPVLPEGAILIFDWMPVGSFCRDAGIQIWYHDYSLRVYSIDEVRFDSSGVSITEALSSDPTRQVRRKTYLDLQKLFIFKIEQGHFYLQSVSRYRHLMG